MVFCFGGDHLVSLKRCGRSLLPKLGARFSHTRAPYHLTSVFVSFFRSSLHVKWIWRHQPIDVNVHRRTITTERIQSSVILTMYPCCITRCQNGWFSDNINEAFVHADHAWVYSQRLSMRHHYGAEQNADLILFIQHQVWYWISNKFLSDDKTPQSLP